MLINYWNNIDGVCVCIDYENKENEHAATVYMAYCFDFEGRARWEIDGNIARVKQRVDLLIFISRNMKFLHMRCADNPFAYTWKTQRKLWLKLVRCLLAFKYIYLDWMNLNK